MTSTELKALAPLAIALPPIKDDQVLSDAQWATLMAIADTIIPSLQVSSEASLQHLNVPSSEYNASTEIIKKNIPRGQRADLAKFYLNERPSSIPEFKDQLSRLLSNYLRDDAKKGVKTILYALDTRAGCLLTTGSSTSFHRQPVNVRHQILTNWSQSYLPPLRDAAKSFTVLMQSTWLKTSPTIGPLIGFPKVPIHGKPGKGFDYEFLQIPPGDEPEVLETDVVIVGSGCGGGVCAKNLAEAGHRVIVTEQAYYWGPEYLPMTEKDAGFHLFDSGGAEVADDNSITAICGRAWGGGGTVNWSASLQTQAFVRKEWADTGLPFFTSSDFQNSLDRVCHRMGVSTDHIEHNPNNKMLKEGARKLGYSYKDVPQNTGGSKHPCGYCTLGCGAAQKQGPAVSFLPDAARAGAHFVEGFTADKVLFEKINGKKTATAVQGTWTSRDSHGTVSGTDRTTRPLLIKAKRVIISAGTFNSPLVLLRSGLSSSHIGSHLYLHPTTLLTAIYPPTQPPINPWEGPILTALVDEFQNLDGKGHGAKLEAMTMLPSWVFPFQAWHSGPAFKTLAAQMPHMTSHISLVRDRDTGRIYPDPVSGNFRIAYTPSAFDKAHAIEGLVAASKIAYVNGATEMFTSHADLPHFVRAAEDANDTDTNNPSFQAWLARMRSFGLNQPQQKWGTAHQMGTCRMSATAAKGVVDPDGKVWGTEGLFVSDASVFPSASGVNPMVTNMAISDYISRGIGAGLGDGENGSIVEKVEWVYEWEWELECEIVVSWDIGDQTLGFCTGDRSLLDLFWGLDRRWIGYQTRPSL